MSIALVVDAACDLPKTVLDERKIILFPITIQVDGNYYTDDKDPKKMQDFYAQGLLNIEHDAESIPFSPEQMQHVFMHDIVPHYDFALVQTVSKKRSAIFDNISAAQPKILQRFRESKEEGAADRHFGMRIINSSTLFTGQGLLALFTSDLMRQGKSKQDITRLVEAFKEKIFAYALPPNVSYIRERARKRGETSLGMLGAFVAKSLDIYPIIQAKNDETAPVAKVRGFNNAANKLFDYACDRIESGLLSPYIVVSYAGDISVLADFDSFKALIARCKQRNISLVVCTMGLTSGLNLGPGAISLALAAEEHSF